MQVVAKVVELRGMANPPADALKDLSRAAVINRTMADLVWPGEDPIGRTFITGGQLPSTVIGVVGDVSVRGVRQGNLPQAYFAFSGALTRSFPRSLSVKAAVPPATVLSTIRERREDARSRAGRDPPADHGRGGVGRDGRHHAADVAARSLRGAGRAAGLGGALQRDGLPGGAANARDRRPDRARRGPRRICCASCTGTGCG